ncbi:MAG: amidohydrolase family protein [Lentisphaeria bacterium]|nr:amidohydrolase family protein [Lentisphaeria bacterium]
MEHTFDTILEFIEGLSIIDTHEHLPASEKHRPQAPDVLGEWLTHYFSCDLVSAGLQEAQLARARDPHVPLMDRWQLLAPYWHAAASTGYGRALALSAQALYGIDRIDSGTIEELNRRFLEARERGGHYRYVLKQKSRIRVSILDANLDADPEFFVSVCRFDGYVCPTHRRAIVGVQERLGRTIHTVRDWKEALETELDAALKRGMVAVKCGLAYKRPLFFEKTTEAAAEAGFNELFAAANSPDWRDPIRPAKALQDHMMHHLLALADARGLAVQFHTGLQEGNGNVITDANPVLLANLLLEYRNVRFDLFHMGYPYMQEIAALAKNFPNAYIDMCWGHIISPEAARRALGEWLDAVPANKISAFGGDYVFVDGVYGHQELARRNVAAALSEKVRQDCFDMDRACEIARWLFVDNPEALFGLRPPAP